MRAYPTAEDGLVGHRFTEHAMEALARRGIDAVDVTRVLDAPDGRAYLLRVVVERWGEDTLVITAYRTTKFAKYGAAP